MTNIVIESDGHTLEYDPVFKEFVTPVDQQGFNFWLGEFTGFLTASLQQLENLSTNPKYANAVKVAGPLKLATTTIALGTAIADAANADNPVDAFKFLAKGVVDFYIGFSSAALGTTLGVTLAAAIFGPTVPVWAAVVAGVIVGGGAIAIGYYVKEYLDNTINYSIDALAYALVEAYAFAESIDPLVIDLDGDGVNTISIEDSNAYFDLDNNGVAENVGWIEPDDGFVVHDWNGDGVINNRSEQFSTFGELARHDTNGDGVVSVADATATLLADLDGNGILESITVGYDVLRIWVDANSDGVTDPGELQTLADMGISQIDLNATSIQIANNGNELNSISSVSFDDGTNADIYGITFNRDAANANFQIQIDALDLSDQHLTTRLDAFLLPQLAGSANVVPLIVATLNNDVLLNELRALTDQQVANTAEYILRVQQFIVDWADVGNVDPSSRPGFGNAQHLAAMEAFVGVSFDATSISGSRAVILQEGWSSFVSGVALRIAVQSGQDFNPGGLIFYDPATDAFSGDWVGFLDNLTQLMQDDATTSRFDNEGLLEMVQSLQAAAGDSSNNALFEAFYDQALTLTPHSVVTDFYTNSAYYDPTQNFSLNDDYQHPSAVAAVIPNGDGATIILTDVDTDFHDFEGGKDEDEVFDLTMHDAGAHLSGVTEYSDNATDDGKLYYGFGDDYYAGFEGSDIYLVNQNVGFDTIDEAGAGRLVAEDVDRLLIQESEEDTILSRDGYDLFISWHTSNNIVRVKDQFYYDNVIEGLVFNGSLLTSGPGTPFNFAYDAAWIEANAWYRGDADRNSLVGTGGNETFHGGKGDDVIDVKTGNDKIVYDSGDGNDVVIGGGGSASTNVLQLRDLNSSDVFLSILEYDLLVEDQTTGHIITVKDQFYSKGLSQISFADGETWDRDEIGVRAVIVGTDFRDDLQSSGRSDTYWGKEGDDALRGGGGSDTYLYAKGDGNDYIDEASISSSTDVLKFTDLNLADIRMTREAGGEYNLYITIIETGHIITVRGQFHSHPIYAGVERIEFADGTFLERPDIGSHLTLMGTDESEILYGSASGEVIIGGLGDDQIHGHSGGDTYIYASGDGSDLIIEPALESSIDVLKFTDINLADIHLTRDPSTDYTMLITVLATGAIITIPGQFQGGITHTGVERIEFADGTSLERTEFGSHLILAGSDQDEAITGSLSGERIIAGLGDDTVDGDAGSDTYVYSAGDGNDVITEAALQGGFDVLEFTDLNLSDVYLTKLVDSDYNLFVTVRDTGEIITINGQFQGYGAGLEQIDFADGTSLASADIGLNLTLAGTDAADNLIGSGYGEQIIGGLGDDTLVGAGGDDTYIYASSDGSDIVDDNSSSTVSVDVLSLTDLNETDIVASRIGSDFFLTVTASGEQIEVDGQFYSSTKNYGVEEIRFADGSIWDRARILNEGIINGTDGADVLNGSGGIDVFQGGLGNDSIAGSGGGDTYIYSSGDGSDFINDNDSSTVSVDVLRLTDLNVADVSISQSGVDSIITVTATGDRIELDEQFESSVYNYGIEEIQFADGTLWDRQTIKSMSIVRGDDAANALHGSDGDDVFNGGQGDDSLYGGAGSDTYIYASGDGDDFLDEENTSAIAIDVLQFTDLNSADIILSQQGTDLVVTEIATGARIEVDEHFFSTTSNYGIEEIHFADGTIWDRARINTELSIPPVEDNIIIGSDSAESLSGTVETDIFQGGLGDDTLVGGGGSDTYEYGSGDGNDFVDEDDASTVAVDVLHLTDLNVADVIASRSGNDFFITVAATGHRIELDQQFYDTTNYYGIEEVHFADGTIWDRENIKEEAIIRGTDSAETINGSSQMEHFQGGLGDDTLRGNDGGDTYIYASGDGNDFVDEEDASTVAVDVLRLTDLNVADVVASRSGNDFFITVAATGHRIELDQQFYDTTNYYGIEEVQFADGTIWDREDIKQEAIIRGTDGAETLNGSSQMEYFHGGLGDDTLRGNNGGDTYIYATGDGNDFVDEEDASTVAVDVLRLTDLNVADVVASRSGNDFFITVAATGHRIELDQQFYDTTNYYGIEEVQFADGTIWDREDIKEEAIVRGTDSAESLYGTSQSEYFQGGLGDDTLKGKDGSDTYIYSSGDGSDLVHDDNKSTVAVDVLRLTDINAGDVLGARSGYSFLLSIQSTGETITVKDQFYSTTSNYGVEEIQFADGEIWDLQRIRAEGLYRGDDGANSLTGTSGDDTFNGGLGNDSLYGKTGSDTYIYASGDGSDFIDEQDASTVSVDVLRFTDINASGVVASRLGTDVFLTILATGDRIELDAQLYSTTDHWGIEEIHFADGETWDRQRIRAEGIFRGDDSANSLTGTSGDDVFVGGLGNDSLYGTTGGDTYIYASGDGSDFIDEQDASTVSVDVLRFTDINASGVQGSRIGTDFFLTILATGDQIELDAQLYSTTDHWGIEEIQFADGEVWDRQRMRSEAVIRGDDGANSLYGTGGDDIYAGGLGDDNLYGDGGADTYIYASGDGNDWLDESGASTTETDVLKLTDLNEDDIFLTKSGDDLMVNIIATGEHVEIDQHYWNTTDHYGIEEIQFADGSVWDRALFEDKLHDDYLVGSTGADTLDGGIGNDRLFGLDGADSLVGGDGNDRLTGGLGDDILQGDAGNDTFAFLPSETGADQILDFDAGVGAGDVIEFDSNTFTAFADVYAAAMDDGTDTTITVDANHSIVLNGILTGQLHEDDFVFV